MLILTVNMIVSVQVMQTKPIKLCMTNNQEADIEELVKKIAGISWKMVLLTPPITFSTPPTYNEEMHEKAFTPGVNDDILLEGKYTLQHMRPVLFYGPLGTVGQKGEVRIVPHNKDYLSDKSDKINQARNGGENRNNEDPNVKLCIRGKESQGVDHTAQKSDDDLNDVV